MKTFSDDMEFLVGSNRSKTREYVVVPVDYHVQDVLKQMIIETWKKMQENELVRYDPANQNTDATYLYMSVHDSLAQEIMLFHEAEFLTTSTKALRDPKNIFCYCARVTVDGQRLTAMRRASYFKGMLKKRRKLMRVVNDTLEIVDDDIFKLDNDFDLLVWNDRIHIWKSTAFESLANIRSAIFHAVSENARTLQDKIPFVCFNNISEYANTRIRAAKALASLQQDDLKAIDRETLVQKCQMNDVDITDSDGMIIVDDKSVRPFLEILGRRRYPDPLVTEPTSMYRAANRQLVKR